jgi:hypothetical protein
MGIHEEESDVKGVLSSGGPNVFNPDLNECNTDRD